jgi:hypothetical protein
MQRGEPVQIGSPRSAFSEGGARAEVHRQRRVAEPAYRVELGCWDQVTSETLIGQALVFATSPAAPSRPSQFVLDMDGMSGTRYRMFINRLMQLHGCDARYLEVGSWKGSTLASAIEGNKGHACAIDNWAEYDGPRDAFFANIAQTPTEATLDVIEADFRSVKYSGIKGGPFNVFMFDGPHNEQDQYDGVRLTHRAMADSYTLIVDDWNWLGVRTGTLKALIDARLRVEHAIEIRTSTDNCAPATTHTRSKTEWHNGYFIAKIRKRTE